MPKSWKKGLAYNLSNSGDLWATSGAGENGVSWWYNWALRPDRAIPGDWKQYGMNFVPMLWNHDFNLDDAVNFINSNGIQHFLVLNEPNLRDQANMTPERAAEIWPKFEEVKHRTRAALVGPQMNWGTLPGYHDPTVWMDQFIAAYRLRYGRDPEFDYLGWHCYDYGLAEHLDMMRRYGRRFWVTEMANWNPNIHTEQQHVAKMKDMVRICESRDDVYRYAWFTGRWKNNEHNTSTLLNHGILSLLGWEYSQAR